MGDKFIGLLNTKLINRFILCSWWKLIAIFWLLLLLFFDMIFLFQYFIWEIVEVVNYRKEFSQLIWEINFTLKSWISGWLENFVKCNKWEGEGRNDNNNNNNNNNNDDVVILTLKTLLFCFLFAENVRKFIFLWDTFSTDLETFFFQNLKVLGPTMVGPREDTTTRISVITKFLDLLLSQCQIDTKYIFLICHFF